MTENDRLPVGVATARDPSPVGGASPASLPDAPSMTGGASPPEAPALAQGPLARQARQDRAGIGQIAHGSTLNLVGAVVMVIGTLGLTVVVTRGFSRAAAGAFFTATSLFLILEEFAVLGADNGLPYFIARLRSLGKDSQIRQVLRSATVPVVLASIAAAALLVVFAHPLASAMLSGRASDGTSQTEVTAALRALALALPFAALLDTMLGGTRGFRDMRPTVAIDRTARSGLQLLAAAVAAVFGASALLAPLWALAYIPCAAAAWILLRRIERRSRRPIAPPSHTRPGSGAKRESFWRFTAPRALAMGAQIMIQRLDIVLVGIMRGPIAAAIYTAATRFLVVCQLGSTAIGMASQPQFSHLFARRDRAGAGTVYQVTTAWLVLLIWPLCLLAIIDGSEILKIFGHSYREGAEVMVILGGSVLLASACGNVDVVLTSTGRSVLSLANGLIALGVNVGVDLALIPRYGITGAAIGWAAAITAANLIPLIQVRRIVRLHPFGNATVRAFALTALSFGAIPALARVLFGEDPVAQLVAVVAGCALLGAGLWRWREPLQLSLIPRLRVYRRGFFPAFLVHTPSNPETT